MDGQTRDEMILEYLPLVKYVASRMKARLPQHIESGDMISAGVMGLIDAIAKFDAGQNVQFRTYAEFRIKGAMLDYLATRNRTLATEVAVETMPELPRTPNVSFSYLLSELKRDLSNKEYTFLEALMHGTEETLGYSPARLRSLKSELRQKVQFLLG